MQKSKDSLKACFRLVNHLSQMGWSTLFSRKSPFPILGLFGSVFFLFFFKFYLITLQANSEDPDQTPHDAVSDLGLHCLPMSHKRLIGVYHTDKVMLFKFLYSGAESKIPFKWVL